MEKRRKITGARIGTVYLLINLKSRLVYKYVLSIERKKNYARIKLQTVPK